MTDINKEYEKEYYDEYRNNYYNPDDDDAEPGINLNWKRIQKGFHSVAGKDQETDETISGMQSNLETLNTDVETLNTDVETLKTDVETLETNVETLNTDVETLKTYVTPEMFGAYGDDQRDDSAEIQDAVDYAIANKKTLVLSSKYVVDSPIVITGFIEMIGTNIDVRLRTNNSNLDCFLDFDNFMNDSANHRATNITIANIEFDAKGTTHAYGFKLDRCWIIYIKIKNITFRDFKNACIYMISTNSPDRVYSHNMVIDGLYTRSCSSIIGQSPVSDSNDSHIPYIYGATLNDIHYEGDHYADYDGNPYVMNLQGFYNAAITNCIFEGTMTGEKSAILYMNKSCHIDTTYFEMLESGYITNYIVFNPRYYARFEITNIYGAILRPLLINRSDVRLSFANDWDMSNANIIDENSVAYRCHINSASFTTGNLKVVPTTINYDQISCSAIRRFDVNDNVPIYNIDTSELKIGGSTAGKYSGFIYIDDESNGNVAIATANDAIYGEHLVITSTGDTDTTRFLRAEIVVKTNNIPLQTGESLTVILTIRPIADVPTGDAHKYYSEPDYRSSIIFDTKEKIKNKCATIVCGKTKGENYAFVFDNSAGTEICGTAQSYEILELAIFKGQTFGYCKSKINVEPSFKLT